MLLSLNRWALRLLPLYKLSLIIAAVGALTSAGLLGLDNLPAVAARLSLVVTLWALLLYSFVSLFKKPVPLVLPALPWREQWLTRLQYSLRYAMACVFVGVVVTVLGLSAKLLVHRADSPASDVRETVDIQQGAGASPAVGGQP